MKKLLIAALFIMGCSKETIVLNDHDGRITDLERRVLLLEKLTALHSDLIQANTDAMVAEVQARQDGDQALADLLVAEEEARIAGDEALEESLAAFIALQKKINKKIFKRLKSLKEQLADMKGDLDTLSDELSSVQSDLDKLTKKVKKLAKQVKKVKNNMLSEDDVWGMIDEAIAAVELLPGPQGPAGPLNGTFVQINDNIIKFGSQCIEVEVAKKGGGASVDGVAVTILPSCPGV